ncbi:DUF456 domain-containing protein [Lutibacter sp. HS1-25]|uniref:DUF456 domain-containing protein n=1 Tax=Lutibacter sp. HS1-25 TaxID=2485000 RepID=UPI0010129854|nr:DUF456 domain-containing protein [Lutibacter sp. HS1-25]RXP56184.1 DUF456 domain-containing protein [Lutibacter sp. HS1-25]
MDIFLLILGFLLIIIGLAGSLLPVLPGPLASWVGLLLLYLTNVIPNDWTFIGVTFAIALIITVIDNFIPAIGTKKFGGTKFGVRGSMVGLIIGMFFGPLGIIFGPFLGAFIGEILNDSRNGQKALKAAFGSFIGFLTSTLLKFIMSLVFAGLFIAKFWEYKSAFFTFNQ